MREHTWLHGYKGTYRYKYLLLNGKKRNQCCNVRCRARVQAVKYRGETVVAKTGMATAIELLGGASEVVDDCDQVDLFGEAEVALGLSEAPRRSGPQGGRPKGARNRSTEEWRRHFLARYPSPLVALGEIYSRTPAALAAELGLTCVVDFVPPGQQALRTIPQHLSEEGAVVRPERYVVWDLAAAHAIQREAHVAALPYVHQRLPQAVEFTPPTRGLFVVGDLNGFGGFAGEGLPLADDKENQRVIDAFPIKSDDEKSDDQRKASEFNAEGAENI